MNNELEIELSAGPGNLRMLMSVGWLAFPAFSRLLGAFFNKEGFKGNKKHKYLV